MDPKPPGSVIEMCVCVFVYIILFNYMHIYIYTVYIYIYRHTHTHFNDIKANFGQIILSTYFLSCFSHVQWMISHPSTWPPLTGSAYGARDFDPGMCHPEKGPIPRYKSC